MEGGRREERKGRRLETGKERKERRGEGGKRGKRGKV